MGQVTTQGLLLIAVLWAGVLQAYSPAASGDFIGALLSARARAGQEAEWRSLLVALEPDYPRQVDWLLQDAPEKPAAAWLAGRQADFPLALARKALDGLGASEPGLAGRLEALSSQQPLDERAALGLYQDACEKRRALRLARWVERKARILFVEGWNLNEGRCSHAFPSDYARRYKGTFPFCPGSKLWVLDLTDSFGRKRAILEDAGGIFRDPDLSFDGKRVLFSWRKSEKEDDFHLYEYDLDSGQTRQLTSGVGVADIEGCYLPNGDIVFNSTRCVIAVDCMGHPALNLYRCDKDGRFLRRLGFDQVGTSNPSVLNDGRVIFTRWEYNDRNPVFLQPLLQMNPDGTQQAEIYGGNSSWPTSLHQAHAIPGSCKILAVASGHHTWQAGLLTVVDRTRGDENGAGLEGVAPRRPFPKGRVDSFLSGSGLALFQYPWPVNENECFSAAATFGNKEDTVSPAGRKHLKLPHFGIYHVRFDGARELLAKTAGVSLSQPVLLAARVPPPVIPDRADYEQKKGAFFIQDVYVGEGLEGIARGTAKRLRVVELEYRADDVGTVDNVAWGNVVTPVSRNGSWDVKKVLGEAAIHEDGSVLFEVPVSTPVYFQILDDQGHMIQSMRSWVTLMPGERRSCTGCHEKQMSVPAPGAGLSIAMRQPAQKLTPFCDVQGGFSFTRHIQPILDRHCIRCHKGDRYGTRTEASPAATNAPPFSLLAHASPPYEGGRKWSDGYLGLVRPRPARPRGEKPLGDEKGDWVNPPNPSSEEAVEAPYKRGAARSRLTGLLCAKHKGVILSREELDKLACWIDLGVPFCGDYTEANAWSHAETQGYDGHLKKRAGQAEIEIDNIRKYVAAKTQGQAFALANFQVFDPGGPEARKRFEMKALDTLKVK